MKNSTLKFLFFSFLFLFCAVSAYSEQVTITIDSRDPNTDIYIGSSTEPGTDPTFSNLQQTLLKLYSAEEIASIDDLKVNTTGTYKYTDSRGTEREVPISIEPNDFVYLNAMPKLAKLDISDATITGRANNNVDNSFPRNAFDSNKTIKSIVLPKNMVGLARNAFSNTALEGVFTIPKGVTNVSEYDMIFGGSTGITAYAVEAGNANLKAEDGILYTANGATLLVYPSGKTGTSFSVPEGVTTIGTSAFGWNNYLEEITLSSTVTTLPRQDKIINNSTKVKAFYVAEGNQRYGATNGFLVDKETATLMAFPPGNTDETIVIDGSIVKIVPSGYFSYAVANLKNIIFTEGVEEIGYTAFKIGNNVTSVLEYIELPSTLSRIYAEAFVGNANLLQVVCKATTPPQLLGQQIFRGSNLASVKLGVPQESVAAYHASQWNRSLPGNDGINCFAPEQMVAYGNVTVIDGTTIQTASTSGFSVRVVADEAPEGYAFSGWTSEPSTPFVNAKAIVGIFTMPQGDITVRANFSPKRPYTLIDAITPSGEAAVTGIVNIEAAPTKGSQVFRSWEVVEGEEVVIENPKAVATSFVMVDGVVTIAARYATAYMINISGGTAVLEAFENEVVAITASPKANQEFVNWTTTTAGVVFEDANSATTTFVMPADEVAVTANFREKTGVDENEYSIAPYPNPAIDYITIDNIQNVNYSIYDISGRTIERGIMNGNQIQVGNLTQGMYIIEAGKYTGRIIKK